MAVGGESNGAEKAKIGGQVISGQFDRVLIRQKSGKKLEIGELLVADVQEGKILLQLFDLAYG